MTNNISTIEQPLVSVVIPAFNRETLIGETLNSLIAQTYSNWECVVVDDGSTDNTIEVIEEYCNKDKRFKLFKRHREPKGAPTCRNIGLSKAEGKYIIFLDSDDILFPYALKQRTEFLEQNPGLDFAVANGIRGEYPLKEKTYTIISTYQFDDVLQEFFNFKPPWVIFNPIYRKTSLIKGKIKWDEKLIANQDIDFHIQVCFKNLEFSYIKETPDSLWNVHNQGNLGQTLKAKNINFDIKLSLFKKHSELIKNKKTIVPLINFLLQQYIFQKELPKDKKDQLLETLKKSGLWESTFCIIKLYQLYRFCIEKKIRIFPSIILNILKLTEQRIYLNPLPNNHFLIKEIDINRIVSTTNTHKITQK